MCTPGASLIFFGLAEDKIGCDDGSTTTASVLAYLRHGIILDVTRGTTARVHDMAVDMTLCRWVVAIAMFEPLENQYPLT